MSYTMPISAYSSIYPSWGSGSPTYTSEGGGSYTYPTWGSGSPTYPSWTNGAYTYPSFGSYFIEGGSRIGQTTISIYGTNPTRGGEYSVYSGSYAYSG